MLTFEVLSILHTEFPKVMRLKRIILSDIIFFVIMLLLTILSIFSYQRINDLNTQSDWVNHTNLIKLDLEQTRSGINDAEKGLRYYLLTRDSVYLRDYYSGIDVTKDNISQVDSLTKDNSLQQLHVKALQSLVAIRIQGFNKCLREDFASVDALINEGKNIMDAINVKIAEMENVEDTLLASRISKKQQTAFITPLYFLLLSFLSLIIVALAYLALRTQTRLRFNAEDSIKKLNDYFKDLPAVFAIVKGPAHVHELANHFYQEISGSDNPAGKTFRDLFPQLDMKGVYEILDTVYTSGKLAFAKEIPITLKRDDRYENAFFNFIYQPVFDESQQAIGILIFGYEITEMIEARNNMEETEQRSTLAIEAANIGTFDWDIENSIFLSSPRLLEIFGYDPQAGDVSHKDLIERFHPDDIAIRNKAVKDSFEKGALKYEVRLVWPDQSIHWVTVYGKIIRNAGRETLRMYGTAIDITEQKTILEELKESEATFRLLADSMPQFVWMADVNGSMNYFNQAVFNYSGLTPHAMQADAWLSIVHPDDRNENISRWKEAISTGNEFIFEHRVQNRHGEYRWHLSRALPQKDPAGIIQRWVGTSTDIQDQKNLSQKLEQQINDRTMELSALNKSLLIKNNIFEQAEENALIGSYSWNLHTGELEYSDNLFRLFGYQPNEFVPSFEKYHSMIHPDDKDQVMQDGMETMDTKRLAAHTYRVITKNGSTKHFRSTGKIFGEGENTMLIGTVQDISNDTKLNEILRLKNLQLERTNAELESFNYIASHDLQEPLRKIQAFSERILQKEGDNFSTFSKDYFTRINSSAARMQNLINALLSYSRADAMTREASTVNLNQVIENVMSDLQDMIDEKQAIIDFNKLPNIYAVGLQIQQLFINLVSNALKYSNTNVRPHIKITASAVSGMSINDSTADKKLTYWKISVEDNGIGFEQAYEHKIFELFQRLHSNSDYTGTGIGLAICKKIVRNHQGYISATGVPGVGATFTIYLPFTF